VFHPKVVVSCIDLDKATRSLAVATAWIGYGWIPRGIRPRLTGVLTFSLRC